MEEKEIQLHGTLHVTICEVDYIGNGFCCGPCFFRKITAKTKRTVFFWKRSLLYATVDIGKAGVGKTRMLKNQHYNPKWHESFHIYCAHMAADIAFTVKDDHHIGASVIGRASIPVQEILNGTEIDRWLEIFSEKKRPIGSKIHVRLRYFDVSRDKQWDRGVNGPKFPGVPYTFFPQRKGCKVFLYQDAHVPDNFVPKIHLSGGKCYEPHRCWEDIFDAIINAKHLIYITGWSVYTDLSLIRDSRRPRPGGDVTLGELLKKKASEGVKVLMLVWEDKSAGPFKEGMLQTHDKATAHFFHDSDVHCVLCPRNADAGLGLVQDIEIATMFTHHQKIVVVDSEMPNGESEKRRIVSFIGGIDLCDGRYDSPFHSLFRTLDTAHFADFHQPNFEGANIHKGGPREPWHDIHCRLEGPVAWDVLFNFEQRWRKQGRKDLLVPLSQLSEVIPPSPITFPNDQETWHVQLFRSIDGGAAFGFPSTPADAADAGLVSGKDNIIDRSIQDAYINAIRRAKKFIYIENQYFLGSSFNWKDEDGVRIEDVDALNLIPKELSLKIVSKIEAGERFTVYIVVPMWPEGAPESSSVQAILDWQRRTMDMMYKDIIQALQAKGIEEDPRNYLTFFCLGNREVTRSAEYEPPHKPAADSDYGRAQQARRFMIYVHAKMMIVDDEYIIIGSANINQRSMDGARDSEIAMGGYQPYHLAKGKQTARGQVHGFRMSLWYENLGLLDDAFCHPESKECVQKVNAMAEKHWDLYSCESLEHDLPGHLLRYPIEVSSEGDVKGWRGMEFFPDTKAHILGSKSEFLPSILTT